MVLEWDELERIRDNKGGGEVPPFCTQCGYNMVGAPTRKCPECGHHFDAREWARYAGQLLHQRQQLEESDHWVWMGAIIVAVSFLIVVLGVAVRPGWGDLFFRIPPLFGGLAATFLGLGRLRVTTPLKHAPEEFRTTNDNSFAVVVIATGIIVVAGAVFAPM